MPLLLVLITVFIAATLLTGLIKQLAPKLQLFDQPVSRSAHDTPVPIGGGLTIVLLFLLVCAYGFNVGLLSLGEFMALNGGALVALVGLIDDISPLDIIWRVPAQLLAALWAVYWLGGVAPIQIGGLTLENPFMLGVLAVMALLWLLNLYNFMDGIDGIAGSELVFVNVLLLFIFINSSDQPLMLLSTSLIAAGGGFLLWNWPPAKIFMGDVGSGFIGFTLGVLALISMHHGSMNLWTWVLLLGVFIADATVTLCRRFIAGQRWYEGHSCHAYQKAAKRYKSHTKVTITVILINCFWLAPLAWMSAELPELGIYLSLLGVIPLMIVAILMGAGTTTDTDSVS